MSEQPMPAIGNREPGDELLLAVPFRVFVSQLTPAAITVDLRDKDLRDKGGGRTRART